MAAASVDCAADPSMTVTKIEDLAVSVTRTHGPPGDGDVTTTHITISMPPASRGQPEKRFASQITLDSDGTLIVQVNGLTKHVSPCPLLKRGKQMFVESPRPNGTKAPKVEEPESPEPRATDTQTTLVGDVEGWPEDCALPTLSEHADSIPCEGQAPVQIEACWRAMDGVPW